MRYIPPPNPASCHTFLPSFCLAFAPHSQAELDEKQKEMHMALGRRFKEDLMEEARKAAAQYGSHTAPLQPTVVAVLKVGC